MNKIKDFGIGEVSERTGITQKQIRYWESQGYIGVVSRIVCGDRAYRRYSDSHIKLLKLIRLNMLRGYSLKGASRLAQQKIETGGGNNDN